MTTPFDPNQQFLHYLQAWRQLLEPLASMTPPTPYPPFPSGIPAMPGSAPVSPTTTPDPPLAPGQYAEQLFGYLQGWRRYLEQMAAHPAPPAYPAGNPGPVPPPLLPIPPDHEGPQATGPSAGGAVADDAGGTAGTAGPTGPTSAQVTLQPSNPGGSMLPDGFDATTQSPHPATTIDQGPSSQVSPSLYGQAAVRARGRQVVLPPTAEFGTRADTSRRGNSGINSVPAQRVRAAQPAKRSAATAQPDKPVYSQYKGLSERARRNQNNG